MYLQVHKSYESWTPFVYAKGSHKLYSNLDVSMQTDDILRISRYR